ncbi:MAG: flagellar type III secretion system pore protein FliP [Pseudomonadota bacterium]
MANRRPSRFSTAVSLAIAACVCVWAGAAHAQDISVNFGDETLLSERLVQILVLVTALSLVPGLAMMITCFPFMVTVLAILRQGLGLQTSPPNILIVSLALFLTYFVMEPVFIEAWNSAIAPLTRGEIETDAAVVAGLQPFREFMAGRVANDTFSNLSALRGEQVALEANAPLSLLVPSFLLSEIERAFQVGFLIFLPFLIIDLVVAAILMSMGMMMVPPAIVSLPFKLAFFVVADGWSLVSSALVQSYF